MVINIIPHPYPSFYLLFNPGTLFYIMHYFKGVFWKIVLAWKPWAHGMMLT